MILLIVVIVLAGLALVIARRPDEFNVSRSLSMNAPASAVFAQVNDLPRWEGWSPWAKLDPTAHSLFEGPQSGVGAVMRWSGNAKVGQGSMTITESRAPDLVAFRLEFLKPFKATNMAEFLFVETGGQTAVRWSMHGKNNFMGKAMGLFIDCDGMVGKQFEQGLASMKAIVESGAK